MANILERAVRARRSIARVAALIGALALGCSDDDPAAAGRRRDAEVGPRSDGSTHETDAASAGRDGAATPPILPPAFGCDDPRFSSLRVEAWPGGGIQVALAARDADGAVRSLQDASVTLHRGDGASVEVALQAYPQSVGLTALLLVPSPDAAEHARRLGAARALIGELPADERIALYLLAPGVPLAAELTERRAHVLARLDELAPAETDVELAPALREVSARLLAVSSAWGPIARSVIAIGAAIEGSSPVLVGADDDAGTAPQSLGRVRLRAGVLQAGLAEPDASAEPEDARSLAAALEAQRQGIALLGACGPFAFDEALELELDGARCELRAPLPLDEWQDASCDGASAAADAYPFANTIALELTPDQLALHDEYAAAKDESNFAVELRIDDSAPIEADAHFRGQTSLDCERKNYSVNLKGDRARRFAPGFANDELYLVSMCKEDAYINQVTASKLLRSLGLFPLDQRYVRLRVAGVDRGVYLLLEKPEDTLLADQLGLAAVVRRRLEADKKKPEVKFPDDAAGAEQARASYEAIAARIDELPADQLAADLAERVDLDGYLDWLALNTYLQCGDSADEAFFYASNEPGQGGERWYFRQHGWDADDLFRKCHHDGQFAVSEPSGLLYCAESNLDRALVVSEEIDARFVDQLERMITTTLPPERIAEVLADTRAELFAQLQDEAVCVAMSELIASYPEVTTCAAMRAVIDQRVAEFESSARARADSLKAAIDALRGAP